MQVDNATGAPAPTPRYSTAQRGDGLRRLPTPRDDEQRISNLPPTQHLPFPHRSVASTPRDAVQDDDDNEEPFASVVHLRRSSESDSQRESASDSDTPFELYLPLERPAGPPRREESQVDGDKSSAASSSPQRRSGSSNRAFLGQERTASFPLSLYTSGALASRARDAMQDDEESDESFAQVLPLQRGSIPARRQESADNSDTSFEPFLPLESHLDPNTQHGSDDDSDQSFAPFLPLQRAPDSERLQGSDDDSHESFAQFLSLPRGRGDDMHPSLREGFASPMITDPAEDGGGASVHVIGATTQRRLLDRTAEYDQNKPRDSNMPPTRATFVLKPTLKDTYGVETDDRLPEVQYSGTSQPKPYSYWKRNMEYATRMGRRDDSSWRQALYDHQVRAIQDGAEVIQKAERAVRLLKVMRMELTGLAMSDYVRTMAEMQGVEVKVSAPEEAGREEIQDAGDYMDVE
ncbi:unnamed protein product [Peniophora sp. CBMAI 1063]|nr:unnamed protein product [Peniophora sp. CBMAI 1063]